MDWADLKRELGAWREAGQVATLWWRDDDAVTDTPALRRLLALAAAHRAPVALAVIPARADARLLDALREDVSVSLLQHGFAHTDHAVPGAKKSEFPDSRPLTEMTAELAAGRSRFRVLFGAHCRDVLVPPWNRLAETMIPALSALGIVALSRQGARRRRDLAPGLQQVNTHLDPIDWHGSRGFIGEAEALDRLVGHLAARRQGKVDPEEPTGLLTHHLVQDETGSRFVERLLDATSGNPAARWIDLDRALTPAQP